MFSKKATIIDEIFTVNLTVSSKCQIDGEDFVNFCGLLRKNELYYNEISAIYRCWHQVRVELWFQGIHLHLNRDNQVHQTRHHNQSKKGEK